MDSEGGGNTWPLYKYPVESDGVSLKIHKNSAPTELGGSNSSTLPCHSGNGVSCLLISSLFLKNFKKFFLHFFVKVMKTAFA